MDPINPVAGNPEALNQTAPLPPRSNKALVITLLIILLLLAGTTAFLAYQDLQLQKQIAELKIPISPSPTPTTTSDLTVNWKTYTTSKAAISISFKYPPTYIVKEDTTRDSIGGIDYLIFISNEPFDTNQGEGGVSTSFEVDNMSKQYFDQAVGETMYEKKFFINTPKIKSVTVGGLVGKEYSGASGKDIDKGARGPVLVLYMGDRVIQIMSEPSLGISEEIFNQILSTFTFTNQPQPQADQTPALLAQIQQSLGAKPQSWAGGTITTTQMASDLIQISISYPAKGPDEGVTEYYTNNKTGKWQLIGSYTNGQQGLYYCEDWEKLKVGKGMSCTRTSNGKAVQSTVSY